MIPFDIHYTRNNFEPVNPQKRDPKLPRIPGPSQFAMYAYRLRRHAQRIAQRIAI